VKWSDGDVRRYPIKLFKVGEVWKKQGVRNENAPLP
jgi:hypothetical protein